MSSLLHICPDKATEERALGSGGEVSVTTITSAVIASNGLFVENLILKKQDGE